MSKFAAGDPVYVESKGWAGDRYHYVVTTGNVVIRRWEGVGDPEPFLHVTPAEKGLRPHFEPIRNLHRSTDRASRDTSEKSKKRFTYFAEDLRTRKRVYANTMKEAKVLAKERSVVSGNAVAVVALEWIVLDRSHEANVLHPQGAYYGARWYGGGHHYPSERA